MGESADTQSGAVARSVGIILISVPPARSCRELPMEEAEFEPFWFSALKVQLQGLMQGEHSSLLHRETGRLLPRFSQAATASFPLLPDSHGGNPIPFQSTVTDTFFLSKNGTTSVSPRTAVNQRSFRRCHCSWSVCTKATALGICF